MTVFTPFWRVQRELPRRAVLDAPARLKLPDGLDPGELPAGPSLADELPEPFCAPGEVAARAAMDAWLDGPIDRYADRHDDLVGRDERPLGLPALGLHLGAGARAARAGPRW